MRMIEPVLSISTLFQLQLLFVHLFYLNVIPFKISTIVIHEPGLLICVIELAQYTARGAGVHLV